MTLLPPVFVFRADHRNFGVPCCHHLQGTMGWGPIGLRLKLFPALPPSSCVRLFCVLQNRSKSSHAWNFLTQTDLTQIYLTNCKQLGRYSESLRVGRSGDRIPVGARFSAPIHTGPGAHPASYTVGTGSFPWVKRPGRGFDHPPLSFAKVKGRVELFYVWVSVHHNSILYKEPTRCNFGSIVY